MVRLACIDVPELPLQLLLLRHPEWRYQPACVVEQDRPQAQLLWVNEVARQAGVLPGMRFSAALGLAAGLKAEVVDHINILQMVTQLGTCLYRHSPEVEIAKEPGVFWLGVRGLGKIYPTPAAWAKAVHNEVAAKLFVSKVVVGFSRFFTYAIACVSPPGIRILRTAESEKNAAFAVPLNRLAASLGISATVRDTLHLLGINTLWDLSKLPGGEILERFGCALHTLHRLVSDSEYDPTKPQTQISGWTEPPHTWHPEEPLVQTVILDSPDENTERLLFLVKRLLDSLLLTLASKHQAVSCISLHLGLDRKKERVERLTPALPTLDSSVLLALVRLRLEGAQLEAGVVEVGIEVVGVDAPTEQLHLYQHSQRDLGAAAIALARIRAWLGEKAVICHQLRDGHLPEANFTETPVGQLRESTPNPRRDRILIRRIYKKPKPARLDKITEDALSGPFVVAGGWWKKAVHREYYFVETNQETIDWVYFDKERNQWFVHGTVE